MSSEDVACQYVPVMNCIFAAQKHVSFSLCTCVHWCQECTKIFVSLAENSDRFMRVMARLWISTASIYIYTELQIANQIFYFLSLPRLQISQMVFT